MVYNTYTLVCEFDLLSWLHLRG